VRFYVCTSRRFYPQKWFILSVLTMADVFSNLRLSWDTDNYISAQYPRQFFPKQFTSPIVQDPAIPTHNVAETDMEDWNEFRNKFKEWVISLSPWSILEQKGLLVIIYGEGWQFFSIFCSLMFHVVCTCTFFWDNICLLTNRKMIKIMTLVDLHTVLTYDCWPCSLGPVHMGRSYPG
jgi:hypothetical protein